VIASRAWPLSTSQKQWRTQNSIIAIDRPPQARSLPLIAPERRPIPLAALKKTIHQHPGGG